MQTNTLENKYREFLKVFINFNEPLTKIRAQNPGIDYETEIYPPVILTRSSLITVLKNAITKKYSSLELETWASDLICLASIEWEPKYSGVIRSVLDFLDSTHSLENMGEPYTVSDFQEQIYLLENANPETE